MTQSWAHVRLKGIFIFVECVGFNSRRGVFIQPLVDEIVKGNFLRLIKRPVIDLGERLGKDRFGLFFVGADGLKDRFASDPIRNGIDPLGVSAGLKLIPAFPSANLTSFYNTTLSHSFDALLCRLLRIVKQYTTP